jgi:uncharacterized integral membrane protein (TIGR00698 family)
LLDHVKRLAPGIVLCLAITAAAELLQAAEVAAVGEPYLEALVLAILLGVAVRTAWTPSPHWRPGVAFSAKFVLECAIVMLGASVSIATIVALGPILIVGIAGIVAVAIGVSYAICRALGLPLRLSVLIACGNSICGNSAIAAVAPVIGADSDEIASAISFTAVLGVVVVLGLPLLVPILHLSLTQYGVLAGLTVYAVPQVLAATLPIGALSNQVGTVIKLVRVLMLGPVVLGFSLFARGLRPGVNQSRRNTRWPRPTELVPWFIVGFLVVLIIRSLGLIPLALLAPVTKIAALLTTVAMAGLGLGVDVRTVARSGARVTLAVTVSLVVLGLMSYALIRATGMPRSELFPGRGAACNGCTADPGSLGATSKELRSRRSRISAAPHNAHKTRVNALVVVRRARETAPENAERPAERQCRRNSPSMARISAGLINRAWATVTECSGPSSFSSQKLRNLLSCGKDGQRS